MPCGGHHPNDQRVANDSQNTNAAVEDGEQRHNFRGRRIESLCKKTMRRLDCVRTEVVGESRKRVGGLENGQKGHN